MSSPSPARRGIDQLPSGRWRARVRIDGRSFAKTLPTEEAALAWVADVQSDARRGLLVERAPEPEQVTTPTVADMWVRYESGLVVGAATQRFYATCWARIKPVVGDVAVTDVKPSDVAALRTYLLGDGLGRSRAKQSVQLLGRLLAIAEKDGIVTRNAVTVAALRWPKAAPKDRPVLIVADLLALASHAKHDRDKALITLLGLSGLRIGEGFGVRRGDVDLAAGTVTVRTNVSDVAGALTVGDPKSHRVRTIALPSAATSVLRERLRETPLNRDALLFPSRAGGPLRYRAWLRDVWTPTAARWNKAREEAGQEPIDLEPHDLRSCYASLLIDSGASIKDLQAALGHSDVTTTLNVYAKVRPGKAQDLAERMDALIAGM